MHVDFSIHTSIKRNKSTVDSFNLISNHSYTNLRENMFEIKRNSNWPKKRKNKLTNGQGGTISQLWAAIFERIRNVQIQDFQTVFFCLLSLPFVWVFRLWFKRYRRHVVYNDVSRDSVTCSLTLRHVTEHSYWKWPVHFFRWNNFHSLSYEHFLSSRITGKLMNKRKINY